MDQDQLQQETLKTLANFLYEIIGEEFADEIEIDMSTSFSADLELESIEFVALAEKMQNHYGKKVDFVTWLTGKDIDTIIKLSVGEVVEFIVQCLSSESTT